jgi:hypothetical protein
MAHCRQTRNVLCGAYSHAMPSSRTAEVQALAVEVVRRHSHPPSVPSRWDLLARWRQRRYQSQLVEAPLQQLRQAVARAEGVDVAPPAARR